MGAMTVSPFLPGVTNICNMQHAAPDQTGDGCGATQGVINGTEVQLIVAQGHG